MQWAARDKTSSSPSGLRPVVIQSFFRRVIMRSEVATTDARASPASMYAHSNGVNVR
jgi:hypothetical protein